MPRPGATAAPSYSRGIQPVLASKCYTCRGPDASKREAGLRLDVRDSLLVVLESGTPAVSLERPDESELIRRITSTDPDYQMPPPDAPKPLEPGEVEALTRWVAAGVPWENHWAFEPLAELDEQGLRPSSEADKRTLLRRLTFGLHGLPPTHEEMAAGMDKPAAASGAEPCTG